MVPVGMAKVLSVTEKSVIRRLLRDQAMELEIV
jgi:hypothetical protein